MTQRHFPNSPAARGGRDLGHDTLGDLADRFCAGLDGTLDSILERCRTEIDGWQDVTSDEAWRTVRDLTMETWLAQAAAVRRGFDLPDRLPPSAHDSAVLAAGAGASLDECRRSFRIGEEEVWGLWLDVIEASSPGDDNRPMLTRALSSFLFEYGDRITELFAEAFWDERGRSRSSLALIREVLNGERADLDALDYQLGGGHLAVIAWGVQPQDALRALARALDCKLLAVEVSDRSWWGWLSIAAPGGRVPRLLARFTPPEGARVATGDIASGPRGFIWSHDRASDAHGVASLREDAVTVYEEVAVEATWLRSPELAKAFARTWLGPIEASAERGEELKRTLREYFAASQNAASAAAALGVHEQTVARRLRAIEEQMGVRIGDARLELEIALRLDPLLRD